MGRQHLTAGTGLEDDPTPRPPCPQPSVFNFLPTHWMSSLEAGPLEDAPYEGQLWVYALHFFTFSLPPGLVLKD